MHDYKPVIALHYTLTVAQAQEGFLLATRSKNRFSQWAMQLGCLLIIAWGLWLEWGIGKTQGGWYFVVLGATFLLLQLLLRFWLLPKIFKLQYQKRHLSFTEQGLDISQQQIVLVHGEQQQQVEFDQIETLQKSKTIYLLTLHSGTVVIIPCQAVQQQSDIELFEGIFAKKI